MSWWLSDPANQMMVQFDDATFCNDICAEMLCGSEACDANVCVSRCDATLDDKLNMFAVPHSLEQGRESSEEEYEHHEHHGHHGHDAHHKGGKGGKGGKGPKGGKGGKGMMRRFW